MPLSSTNLNQKKYLTGWQKKSTYVTINLLRKEQKNHHRKNENTVNNIENTADNANSVNNAHSLSRYENVSTATHNIAAIASCEYNNMEDAIPVKFSATNLPAIVDEIVGNFNDDVDEVAQKFKVIYANSKDNDRMIELRIIGKHQRAICATRIPTPTQRATISIKREPTM